MAISSARSLVLLAGLFACGGKIATKELAKADNAVAGSNGMDAQVRAPTSDFHGAPLPPPDLTLSDVDTIGYDVDLTYRGTLATSRKTPDFEAKVTVSYVATASINSFAVDFREPHLRSVLEGERSLTFSAEDADHVRVILGRVVAAGTNFRITYSYEISSRAIDAREADDGGLVVTPNTVYSASWPRKGRWWLPLRDAPRDGAMFAARLTFPAEYTVVSNGISTHVTSSVNGMRTWSFELLSPIPTYSFFVGASTNWVRAEVHAKSGIPMPSWVTREHASRRQAVFGEAVGALDFLESTLGPCPFPQVGFVEVPTTWMGGGMEHATVVAIDPVSMERVADARRTAIHELTHHYSGNSVRIATWADFWLSEGFTEYLTVRAIEAVEGAAAADLEWKGMIYAAKATTGRHPLRPRNDNIDVRDIFDTVPYAKGAWVVRVLETTVGRVPFDAFLRTWFTRHTFAAVTTEVLQRELEAEFHRSFADLFERAVYGTGLPE